MSLPKPIKVIAVPPKTHVSVGFKCAGGEFFFVVLKGTQQNPSLVEKGHRKVPKLATRSACLGWFRQNFKEVLQAHKLTSVSFRGIEPVSKNKSLDRSEAEGVLQEVAHSEFGIECKKRIKKQIASCLADFDGSAKYVQRVLPEIGLEELTKAGYDEAALVSLCGLPVEPD